MKKKFQPAINGLFLALKDRGVQIQVLLALCVIVFGLIVHFNYMEWLCVFLVIGLVICTEILNTCIEKVCDLYSTNPNSKIKVIKDMAAGSVLFAAIIALILFAFILMHRFI